MAIKAKPEEIENETKRLIDTGQFERALIYNHFNLGGTVFEAKLRVIDLTKKMGLGYLVPKIKDLGKRR